MEANNDPASSPRATKSSNKRKLDDLDQGDEDFEELVHTTFRRCVGDEHGEQPNYEDASKLFEKSLELQSPGQPPGPLLQASAMIVVIVLFRNLSDRNRSNTPDTLEKNIQLLTRIVGLDPPGSPGRDLTLHCLAICFGDRYRCSDSLDDLQERIRLLTEVLELRPRDHQLRATTLEDLAGALRIRYGHSSSADDLSKRLQLLTEALELCPPGNPDRASSLHNLASALSDRYDRSGSADDLEEQLQLLSEALKFDHQEIRIVQKL